MVIRFQKVIGMIMHDVPQDQLPKSMQELNEIQQARLVGYWLERRRNRMANDAREKGRDGYVLQAVYQYRNQRYAVTFGEEQEKGTALRCLEGMAAAHQVPIGDRIVFWGMGYIHWTLQGPEHPVLKAFHLQHSLLLSHQVEPTLWLGVKGREEEYD